MLEEASGIVSEIQGIHVWVDTVAAIADEECKVIAGTRQSGSV